MDFWENIEAYINNDLSETERKVFEKAMSNDAALRQSVDEHQLLINLLRQNKGVDAAKASFDDVSKRRRLKGIIDGYIAELPDAPVELPKKEENTEGVKIVPLNPKPFKEPHISKRSPFMGVKKTNIWWAAAASVALVAAVGIWWMQHNIVQQTLPIVQTPPTAQTPPTVLPSVGTLKKVETKKKEEKIATALKNDTPQYKIENASEDRFKKFADKKDSPNIIYIATHGSYVGPSDATILAEVKTAIDIERKEVENGEPTKSGGYSNSRSDEDKALLTAFEAISGNKPQDAVVVLEKRNQKIGINAYYLALANLLKDKETGIKDLQTLAKNQYLGENLRTKINNLLNKIQ